MVAGQAAQQVQAIDHTAEWPRRVDDHPLVTFADPLCKAQSYAFGELMDFVGLECLVGDPFRLQHGMTFMRFVRCLIKHRSPC